MRPTYLFHLSDGSIANGLVDQPEHDAALRLNLLIFEYLAIAAPGLLRNHFLYDTISGSKGDRNGLEQAYRKGLIRPIVISEKETDSDAFMRVADTIRTNDPNPIGLSDPARNARVELLKHHAELVCKAGVSCVRVPFVRACYRPYLLEVIEKARSMAPSDGILAQFAREIEDTPTSNFRVIDAYRIAEKMAREGTTDCRRLKSMAVIAKDWLTNPTAVPQFAVPQKATRFTDLCTRVWPRGLAEPKEPDGVQERVEIDIPPGAIGRLTLGEVIEARDTELIKEIQETVASLGKQPPAELGAAEADKWDDLAHGFRRWLAQETRIGREGYLKEWERLKENRKRLGLSWITSAAQPIGIMVGAGVTSAMKGCFDPEATGLWVGGATWLIWLVVTRVVSGGKVGVADSAVYQPDVFQPEPSRSPEDLKWHPVSAEIRGSQ